MRKVCETSGAQVLPTRTTRHEKTSLHEIWAVTLERTRRFLIFFSYRMLSRLLEVPMRKVRETSRAQALPTKTLKQDKTSLHQIWGVTLERSRRFSVFVSYRMLSRLLEVQMRKFRELLGAQALPTRTSRQDKTRLHQVWAVTLERPRRFSICFFISHVKQVTRSANAQIPRNFWGPGLANKNFKTEQNKFAPNLSCGAWAAAQILHLCPHACVHVLMRVRVRACVRACVCARAS